MARTSINRRKGGTVFASKVASTVTTITTAGTYEAIDGAFNNKFTERFQTVADPAIQCLCPIKKKYEVDWHATCSADDNGRTVSFGIKTGNGVLTLDTDSVMSTFLKTANESETLSGTTVVELGYGDKVQLVVTSNADGDNISVIDFTTTIREFD